MGNLMIPTQSALQMMHGYCDSKKLWVRINLLEFLRHLFPAQKKNTQFAPENGWLEDHFVPFGTRQIFLGAKCLTSNAVGFPPPSLLLGGSQLVCGFFTMFGESPK